MEPTRRRQPADAVLGCVLAVCLCAVCGAERLCTVPPGPVAVPENNTADVELVKIVSGAEVALSVTVNPEDLFYLKGNALMAKKGLDYESLHSAALTVWVQCSKGGSRSVNESVEVLVENENDNPPNFAQSHYVLEVNELTPVNSSVGLIEASDVDSEPLFYRLEPATDKYFRLENINTPKIIVKSILDYDVVQKISLVLHVQDTLDGSASDRPFFTSVATITVQVRDVDNRPPWFQPCLRTSSGIAKLCVSTGYRGKVNLTEKEDGPLVLEPGPLFARDGDKNRSEQISYRILRGNEGNIFQIDEETGNISMAKAADIVGPITLTVLASQVTNRDQFSVTQVTFDVMKKSRNPPRFEKERYEGFIYSNSVPESMILRDRSTNRPFRVRARDEDFATGANPDVKYEVQYSSYVNVTLDGFVVLKRVVKTESFALQCLAPCLKSARARSGHRDSLQYTNDGFQTEGDPRRLTNGPPGRGAFPQARGRVLPMERRGRQCSSCGVHTNHVPKGSPSARPSRRGRWDGDEEYAKRVALNRQRRKEGQKTVWFKESEDSSDIEVEIIPDTVSPVAEETEEELDMEAVVRDPAAPLREPEEVQSAQERERGNAGSGKDKEGQEEEG
uniref:Cadherin domain-containing protein n=1 Tax=Gasterosteus aculeatus aculeatus TaxID=481459 RepID=G3PYT2_GASAC